MHPPFDKPMLLSPRTIASVRNSWANILSKYVHPAGILNQPGLKVKPGAPVDIDWKGCLFSQQFYSTLIASDPNMKEVFWRFNLFSTMQAIAEFIQNGSEPLVQLGHRHRSQRIENSDYDKAGKIFKECLVLVPDLDPVTAQAWCQAWDYATTIMKIPEYEKKEIPLEIQTNLISLAEIRKHAHRRDAWMVIDGCVYNVTSFISSHPGKDIIEIGFGKEVTSIFQKSHTQSAHNLLSHFMIGVLQEPIDCKPPIQPSPSKLGIAVHVFVFFSIIVVLYIFKVIFVL